MKMNAYQYLTWAGNPGDNCGLCGRTTKRGFLEIPLSPIGKVIAGGLILCEMCGIMRRDRIILAKSGITAKKRENNAV